LRRQVEELQGKLQQVSAEGPPGIEKLAHGGDEFDVRFVVERKGAKKGRNDQTYWVKVSEESAQVGITWDDLFAHIAPRLIEPTNDYTLTYELNNLISSHAMPLLMRKFPGFQFANFRIFEADYKKIKIQLRALGLIATADNPSYWTLSDYGDAYMNRLLAVPRRDLTPRSTGTFGFSVTPHA
jgi:hypothetical protein